MERTHQRAADTAWLAQQIESANAVSAEVAAEDDTQRRLEDCCIAAGEATVRLRQSRVERWLAQHPFEPASTESNRLNMRTPTPAEKAVTRALFGLVERAIPTEERRHRLALMPEYAALVAECDGDAAAWIATKRTLIADIMRQRG